MTTESLHRSGSTIRTQIGPLIFLAVADALLWIMLKRGVSWAIHYIDDFLTIGRHDSQECVCNIALMQRVSDEAGELSKSVGPATTLVFLGIEIDSFREELRLPEDKLMQLNKGGPVPLERAKSMQKEGSTISYRATITCCEGGQSWVNILA